VIVVVVVVAENMLLLWRAPAGLRWAAEGGDVTAEGGDVTAKGPVTVGEVVAATMGDMLLPQRGQQ
jgi:hypothetical protein